MVIIAICHIYKGEGRPCAKPQCWSIHRECQDRPARGPHKGPCVSFALKICTDAGRLSLCPLRAETFSHRECGPCLWLWGASVVYISFLFSLLFFPPFLNLHLTPWNDPVMQGEQRVRMSLSFRSLQISWWPWGSSASTSTWQPSISWSLTGRPCTTPWR